MKVVLKNGRKFRLTTRHLYVLNLGNFMNILFCIRASYEEKGGGGSGKVKNYEEEVKNREERLTKLS